MTFNPLKKIHHSRIKLLCEKLGKLYEDDYRFVFIKHTRSVEVVTYRKIGDEWEDGSEVITQDGLEFLETWASTVVLDTDYYGWNYVKPIELKAFKDFLGVDRVYTTPIHEHLAKKNKVKLEVEPNYDFANLL